MSCLYRNDSLAASYSHRGKPPTTIGAEELNFRVRHGYILRITDYNGYENSSLIYTMAIFEESMLRKILMI